MNNKFKLGFMVGRMQPIHKGHEQLIDLGLSLCDRFVILLGNAETSRTKNNPFTFEERKTLIKEIYGDKVEIYPIINIGIGYVPEWGNYLMNTIKYYCGEYPDFVINGTEVDRNDWIDKNVYDNLTELTISRNLIPINASMVRCYLAEYGFSSECKAKDCLNKLLHPYVRSMGSIIRMKDNRNLEKEEEKDETISSDRCTE